jgi:DnaK suppressor protein
VEADRARDLLATERARIQDALALLWHDDDPAPIDDADPGDLASDLYQEELDEGLAESPEEQLAAVARAEARLDAGTYGLSVVSGHPIPDERLEAVPTAELTVEEERAQSA